jgi:alpha-N-arabinofuranosidase
LDLPSSATIDKGEVLRLSLALEEPGTVWLDQSLLFPADHIDGWDPEVVAYMRDARLPLLRFPGGNFASGYHWQDGIGPLDSRPAEPNPAWFGVEWDHVGTDEWLGLCELVGAEPLICVNAGDGTPEEAAAWVEYCNGDIATPMGALRAANGHPEPYRVKRWEIGNELYGSWQIGHTDAQGYAERYADFHAAMAAVDPDLEFIACGYDAAWNRTVVRRNPTTVRSFSVHTLPGSHIPEEADPLEVYLELMGFLESYPTELRRRAAPMAEVGIPPKLAITELQIFTKSSKLPNNKTLTEALWTAGIYNLAIRSGGAIELVTHSALVNHGGGLEKLFGVVYPDPVWWTTHLYSTMSGSQPVAVEVAGSAFSTEGRWFPRVEDVPYLDAVALLDPAGEELTLLVVNRHPESTLAAQISVRDFQLSGEVLVSLLSGESFMARNSWDDSETVRLEETVLSATASFIHEFPPHSLTVMRLRQGEAAPTSKEGGDDES